MARPPSRAKSRWAQHGELSGVFVALPDPPPAAHTLTEITTTVVALMARVERACVMPHSGRGGELWGRLERERRESKTLTEGGRNVTTASSSP